MKKAASMYPAACLVFIGPRFSGESQLIVSQFILSGFIVSHFIVSRWE